ncbi:fatty acyl-CoA hydrolase precursor, medium chain-like [Gastrophryne carolinensis]
MTFWLVLGLLYLVVLRAEQAENRPRVEIKYGKLQGVIVPVKETQKTADAYFGIPFAKPPVGPLRFANPEAPEPWKSIRDASKYSPVCLQDPKYILEDRVHFQSNFEIPPVSEDCLYLNVFTPSHREEGSNLPVMVYMHGGGLLFGGSSLYDGSALSVFEDVVVVAIQYRLGILGFFSTGDDQLPGNLGLMDQVAALRWVQENIADFGGNPKSVTIFGESAGGISTAAHVMSPLSKGLFHRAIAESGTMKMPGLVVSKSEDLKVYHQLVSELSGCDLSSVVKCLKEKSEEEMLKIMKKKENVFLPVCVDGVFLPKPVDEIMANKESNDVPLLLGFCDHDFGWLVPQVFNIGRLPDQMSWESVQQKLERIQLMNLSPSEISLVLEEYLASTTNGHEIRDRFLDIGTDRIFAMPALETAKSHRDSGHPVYVYEFQHRPSIFKDTRPDYVKSDHIDDLLYVLGTPFLRDGVMFAGKATDEEKTLAKIVMKYWANFARNGDPNSPGLVKWPQYDAKEGYLGINLKPKASFKPRGDKFKFWTEILPLKSKSRNHAEL